MNPSSGVVLFFQTVAGAVATLVGLSFVSLSFFLSGLYDRYRTLAIPVFLSSHQKVVPVDSGKLEDQTDEGLLDGDPLVVFIAYSVAVSWMMHLIPLTISLTMITEGFATPGWLIPEIAALLLIQTVNAHVRRRQYRRLGVYRTRDEYLWSYFENGYLLSLLATEMVLCRVAWPKLFIWLVP